MNTRSLLAKRRLFQIAFWTFAILVLFATLTPLDGLEINIDFELISVDKLIHLLIFLMLTVLLHMAYPKIRYTVLFLYLTLYGLIIELLQHILPLGRAFEWMDWIYDMIGVIIGIIIIYNYNKHLKYSRN